MIYHSRYTTIVVDADGNNKSMILTTPKSSLLVVKLVLLDPYKVEVMTEVFNSAATTKYGTNI